MSEISPDSSREPFGKPLQFVELDAVSGEQFRSPIDSQDTVIRNDIDREPINLQEKARLYQKYLDTLADSHIEHSGYSPVIAQKEVGSKPTIYAVTNKVYGESLYHSRHKIPAKVISGEFDKMLTFYETIAQNGGYYDKDMHLDQFVYGHTADNDQDRPILVDLDATMLRAYAIPPSATQLEDIQEAVRKVGSTAELFHDVYTMSSEQQKRLARLHEAINSQSAGRLKRLARLRRHKKALDKLYRGTL